MKKVVLSLLLAFVCLPMAFAQVDDAPVFQRINKTACGSYYWSLTNETYTTDTAVFYVQGDTAYGLFLTMAEPTYDTLDTVFLSGNCGAMFRDSLFTIAGTYDAVMVTASGCDSVIRLSVTLTGVDSTDQTLTVCDSMLAPWGQMLYASGNFVKDTVINGCNRHDILNLTVNSSYSAPLEEVTAHCSYSWQGLNITDTLVHEKKFRTAGGCDSTISIRVTNFDNHIVNYDTAAACDQYVIWGNTYTTSGDQVHHDTVNNCVTTTNLNLTISSSYLDTTAVVVEDVVAGCFYKFAGQTYTDTNTVHYGTLTTANGCDSLAAIRITGYTSNEYDSTYREFCGYRYNWGSSTNPGENFGWVRYISNPSDPDGTSLATSTDIVTADTTYTASGCTYHRHIELLFVHDYDTSSITGCDSIRKSYVSRNGGANDPNYWVEFRQSGLYTADTNGEELYSRHFSTKCVTHHALNVNIIVPEQHVADTMVIDECDSYSFNLVRPSNSYTFTSDTIASPIYKYRNLNSGKCYDTIVPLNITIRYTTYIDTTVTICDEFTWEVNGQTYTNNTVLRETLLDENGDHLLNSQGCDSIGRLNLTIHKSPEVTIEGNWILEPGQTANLSANCTMSGVTYAWYIGTSTSPASTTSSLVVEPQGNENVDVHLATTKAYGQHKCITDNWITVTTNVGIDDIEAMMVNIYPNPTSRILNLQSAEGIAEVVIYNTIGQQVMLRQGNGERMQLDLADLATGTYTLRISGLNGEQITRKINVIK